MKNLTYILFLILVLNCNLIGCAKMNNLDKKKKVLMVVTSHSKLGNTDKQTGYWLSEVTHPFEVLSSAGFDIDIASPEGGKAPADPRSLDLKDDVNERFFKSKEWNSKLQMTLKLEEVNPAKYSVVIFAGGHGPMWDLTNNKTIGKIAASVYERGGIVSAVCHGPVALLNIKLSNGKYLIEGERVTAFTNEEEAKEELSSVVPFSLENELVKRGAKFIKAPVQHSNVVVSNRLITGQNPASATLVGEEIVKLSNQI